MALKKQARDPTVDDVLEVKNFNSLLVQWFLSYLQRKIGVDVGVEPGAEMKAAIAEAESRNIPVALVDRDIRLTLLRFWKSMGIIEKIKMVFALIYSIAEVDGGEEIDIESLKEQNIIDAVMEEFRRFSPNGAHALIDERDAFIAHQLVLLKVQRPEARILAVVGAGHRQGITTYVEQPQTLPPFDALTREPKSFPWAKIFGFAVTGLFAFLLAAIAFSGVGLTVLSVRAPLLGDHSWSACRNIYPHRRWPPVFRPHLFWGGMDDLLKPAATCGMVCRVCGGEGTKTASIRFPENLRDRIDPGDVTYTALQSRTCSSTCKYREPDWDRSLFYPRFPAAPHRPRDSDICRSP